MQKKGFIATVVLSSILLTSVIAISMSQQVSADPNNSEIIAEFSGTPERTAVFMTATDPDLIDSIGVRTSDGIDVTPRILDLRIPCSTDSIDFSVLVPETSLPLTVTVTDCTSIPSTDTHTVPPEPEELTKEQQKAIDKSIKELGKACKKISKEIAKLGHKGQTIPIEIVELQLRACEPITIP